MDVSNTHKNLVKDRACGSGDILADRETHRQTYSSQYFAVIRSTVINTTYNVIQLLDCDDCCIRSPHSSQRQPNQIRYEFSQLTRTVQDTSVKPI